MHYVTLQMAQVFLAILAILLALVVCAWIILPAPKHRPPATQSKPPATQSRRRRTFAPLAFVVYALRLIRRDRGQA